MLNLDQGKIYTFKMNSGEEIVAKALFTTGDFITVGEPISVAQSQQGIGLIPTMFTAETKNGVRLNTNSISMCAESSDRIQNMYIEATTGIKVPDKQIVLG
jgi:hypothetical protein